MAKKKRKQRRPKQQSFPKYRPLPQKLLNGLEEADRLMRRKRWHEALEQLQALNRRYPNRPEILSELVNVYYELNDMQHYLLYIQRLSKVTPADPELLLGLAGAYLANIYPAAAAQTFRRFLERYPDHEQAADARQALSGLENSLNQILADLELSGEAGFELAAQHDEVRALLETGQLREARQAAKQILDQHPYFVPVLNNMSQIDFAEGQLERAIATAEGVLSINPDNFQALGNLTRFLYVSGRTIEARQYADRLETVESAFRDIWLKKAEAFTYLGDNERVLEAFQAAGLLEPPLAHPFLYHLAAVAVMRQGDEKEARQYWQQALALDPNFDLARDNLADLELPVGERHAPWPFSIGNWVSQQALADIAQVVHHSGDKALARSARNYLKKHPELVTLVPILLERGDPHGREFALILAATTETPELLAALHDFVLSQHGPDAMRHRALQVVSEAGLLPPGPVRMWIKGEWQEIVSMNFEIYEEPDDTELSPEAVDLLGQATEALYEEDPKEAEGLLKQALEIAPDSPEILNNLGAAYQQQGRRKESEEIVRQLYKDHPDYFFGQIGMANIYTGQGNLDEAEAILKPLMSRERLHISEFNALCMANIQFYLARDLPDGARTWLEMWADLDPDNPNLDYWRLKVGLKDKTGKLNLGKLFGRS